MSTPQSRGRDVATLVALIGVIGVIGLVFGLVAMVLGSGFLLVVFLLVGMVGVAALQYVIWGWKLDRDRIHDDEEIKNNE